MRWPCCSRTDGPIGAAPLACIQFLGCHQHCLRPMELNGQPVPLDFAGIAEIDGSLSSVAAGDGRVDVAVVEHLRVQVPAAARTAWLEAEQGSWEPWLNRQPGFLGRDLSWDGEHEQGQLLIHWASREQWLAIPRQELDLVQERFERLAHAALVRLGATPPLAEQPDLGVNPFPLVYEGELPPLPQAGLTPEQTNSRESEFGVQPSGPKPKEPTAPET